jgi:hypothetical protein
MLKIPSSKLPPSIASEALSHPDAYVLLTFDLERVGAVVFPSIKQVASMKTDGTYQMLNYDLRGAYELVIYTPEGVLHVALSRAAEIEYASEPTIKPKEQK